jgi:His/Glu/Gln/Arg/opine family amino acid ABC transporter permease subunit
VKKKGIEQIKIKRFSKMFFRSNKIIFVLLLIISTITISNAKNDNFKVALTGKYPPFSMYDSHGNLAGFDVDVSKAIADKLDKKLILIATQWDAILPGLLTGKYDVIIGSMAVTKERSKKVNFSDPYYESGAQLFIHKRSANSIKSINDCTDKRIGVVLGETFAQFLRNKHPGIERVTYKSTVDIFNDLDNGRISGFVSDKLLGMYQIKKSKRKFIPTGELLFKEQMAIPVNKNNKILLQEVNKALSEMRESGELQQLFDKWFSNNSVKQKQTSIKRITIIKLFVKGFGLTLLVAFLSIIIGFLLAVPGGLILNNKKITGNKVIRAVNDLFRGTPVLIQLFFVYFGIGGLLSQKFGINLSAITAAIFTLSINAAAYMSEVVRSGLMSVPMGQKYAAKAIGFNKWQIFSLVIWPQAFRIALPPLMNSVVALIKDTALISVITVPEIIRQAQSVISITFDPIKYYLIVALMFYLITFPLMKFSAILEKQIKEKGFGNA